MLNRIKTEHSPKPIPQDWLESASRLLNEAYDKQLKKENFYFDVFGQIFTEELLVVVSYLSEKNEGHAPITLFLSCDKSHIETEKKVKETLENYLEISGLFFDEIFSNKDWNEFEPNWQEVEHNKEKFFYKISRENINLTLEANKLLGEDFFKDEDE